MTIKSYQCDRLRSDYIIKSLLIYKIYIYMKISRENNLYNILYRDIFKIRWRNRSIKSCLLLLLYYIRTEIKDMPFPWLWPTGLHIQMDFSPMSESWLHSAANFVYSSGRLYESGLIGIEIERNEKWTLLCKHINIYMQRTWYYMQFVHDVAKV